MPRKYRPSNGTEGDGFYKNWCFHCTRDAAFRADPDSGDGCPIAASTYVFDIDDPLYPTEWIEDDNGPRCTAFTTDANPPERCDKTPDMFAPQEPDGARQDG